MPEAKLRLTIPPDIWIGDITRDHPETRVRVLAAIPDGLTGVGLAEVTGPGAAAVVAEMADEEELTDFETLQHRDGEALVQFETTNPLLLFPARGSGTPLQMPFDIQNGVANWEVTAPNDRLSALGEQLEEFGIQFTVDYVHQHTASEQLLTDRQRELVQTAVEEGYYDTPRGCSLTELAETVGIAKSSCSDTLHRAEETIIKSFVERQVTGEPPSA
ncbi:helix-turn-helix domain-containing protein [Haloarcula amylovorans]|uniref:helix-turn-helix domain-containing protein n=1 Tax=Haloarcula amylovorans TaxID=2562280 RepID=UPI0010769C22|nr:helix-turn-helix domain-containing protein [Halomicroarcula amylolytica]